MIFWLTNDFYHDKQAWKPIKYSVLINGDLQITESYQEVLAVVLKYEMKPKNKPKNKPYGNIPSHPMPHQYCPAQNYLLFEYNGFVQAEGNSDLGNIGETQDDLVCCWPVFMLHLIF